MRTSALMHAAPILISFFTSVGIASADSSPSPAEVIKEVLANRDLPLTVDPSCVSAPIDPSARTIGDYFSQLVAAMQDKRFDGLKLTVRTTKLPDGWSSSVIFNIDAPDAPWHYGISFRMMGTPPKAIPNSFRCPGV